MSKVDSMAVVPEELIMYIVERGKEYAPALCPDDIHRGAVGSCFDTSTVNALEKKYRYVEGVVTHPKTGEPVLHAWLTDGIRAYDPTWRAFDNDGKEIPVPTEYIGIEMPIEDVARFMLSTKYASILANAWRNPELARAASPECPIIKP